VPNGGKCSKAVECASGHCSDGYCCDADCSGQCQACNVSGHEGLCTLVTGAPIGARSACPGD
jgi:hypothetical protein